MTNRLYYTDAYRAEFTAALVDRSDDGRRVYLDETAFYPTSGGQLHDTGTLNGLTVIDVQDEGERVAHVLDGPMVDGAGEVIGIINWARRYDHMQQHTGQHLLSAVFEDLFGGRTASVHFGPDYSTVDIELESMTQRQLAAAEERANAVVGAARSVTVTFEDAATIEGLRKASDRSGTLRIVSIDGIDRSACGGTHVRSTAEIGPILLRAIEKVRKTTRIEFVCGVRAIRQARADYDSLTRIASSLSASLADAPLLVGAQADRLKESEGARKKLARELAALLARELYDAAVPNSSGVRTIVIRDAASIDNLRDLAQAAFALPRVVVVGTLSDPPSILFAASEDSGVDAGQMLKERLAAAGGRGGGSPRLAQGSVPDYASLEAVVEHLVRRGG
ncbi:MAG TPA: alanyl-tRNA editing protein [Gemmatimonadaceae bacterium]|nr:alanyl-tRNA editing protein [Gemmatimonadaceae bacterium]